MDQIREFQTKALLEDLFYALSGFDTSRIYLEGDAAHVTVVDYPAALIEPFTVLVIKVREFYSVEKFGMFVSSYLKRVCTLRKSVATVEELLVNLQDDLDIFRDLDRFGRGEPIDKNGLVHRHFQQESHSKLVESINSWINLANPCDIVEIKPAAGFASCFWKDYFRLRDIDVAKEEMEGIEDCGKIVFFIRAVFGMEVVDDESYPGMQAGGRLSKRKLPPKSPYKKADVGPLQELPGTECGSNISLSENPFNSSRLLEKHVCSAKDASAEISHGVTGTKIGEGPAERLLAPFYYAGSIRARRSELHSMLNALISDRIHSETSQIHSIVYMQDFNIFLGIFGELGADLLTDRPIARKLNDCLRECCTAGPSFVAFELGDVELGEYVLKLLQHHRAPQPNRYLLNLQKISVVFDGGVLRHFVSGRSFIELKIVFRFLFSLSAIIYYLERSRSYNFTRVLYLIFMRLKSGCIGRVELGSDIDSFIGDFSRQISGLLNCFYLTNADVFAHLSRLMDTSYEYLQIEYKENIDAKGYSDRVRAGVAGLLDEILRCYGDNDFTEFLRGLHIDGCLK